VSPTPHASALPAAAMTASDPAAPLDLAALFAAHGRRLYRLALRLASDAAAAEDLVQETFLRAARRPQRVPTDPQSGEKWLVRVLVNLARDDFRRRRTRRAAAAQLELDERDPVDAAGAALARHDVGAALARLPARRRAVVVLHELEELDVAAIARLLGIARVTVRWHLAAGRAELRRRLDPSVREEERP
jgi:RNA polymerase sigma factor (sigma-70 family)